jgi:ferredoxin-NADP reductase
MRAVSECISNTPFRTPEEAICSNELFELAKRNPNISVRIRCTKADGRLDRADIYSLLAQSPDLVFYLCGSERFVKGVTFRLLECGVPSNRIKTEAFKTAGEKPPATAAPAPMCPVRHARFWRRVRRLLDMAMSLAEVWIHCPQ